MRDFFPIIELKGKPYEMGKIHGRTLAKEIKALLKYLQTMMTLPGLSADTQGPKMRNIFESIPWLPVS